MKVKILPVSQLVPFEENPRRISDDAVSAVAASIAQFGFRQPIVVDAGMVICEGHTRRLAAIKLGLDAVPVHVADDLSPGEIDALRIADNQTGSLSEFDRDLLSKQLQELGDFDWNALGFTSAEMEAYSGGATDKLEQHWEDHEAANDGETDAETKITEAGDRVVLRIHNADAWEAFRSCCEDRGVTWANSKKPRVVNLQ